MKLWIKEGILSLHDLALIEQQAKKIKVPSDLGRIPNKIAMRDSFSDFTADQ